MKRIAILGSTGSIGTQAAEVISQHKDDLCAEILVANNNYRLLAKQAEMLRPNAVVIVNEGHYEALAELLKNSDCKVYSGMGAAIDCLCSNEVDFVLTAVVGSAGLLPTVRAIESGKAIGLANKETLVVAGELITSLARDKGVNIYPVDSEHSAIFQCMAGEWNNPIEKIYLTASGGPFRGSSCAD